MNELDDDALDRALFALPLAVPPAGMRAAILRATVGAGAVIAPAFAMWEVALIGTVLAVTTWLAIVIVADRAFDAFVFGHVALVVRALADPTILVWLATGGSIAACASLGTFGSSRRMRGERS